MTQPKAILSVSAQDNFIANPYHETFSSTNRPGMAYRFGAGRYKRHCYHHRHQCSWERQSDYCSGHQNLDEHGWRACKLLDHDLQYDWAGNDQPFQPYSDVSIFDPIFDLGQILFKRHHATGLRGNGHIRNQSLGICFLCDKLRLFLERCSSSIQFRCGSN